MKTQRPDGRIIDSHVHLPAPSDSRREAEVLEAAMRNGISMLILSCLGDWSPFPSAETVRAANAQSFRFVRTAPDRARWLAYLNPQLDSWRAELDACLRDGAVGIKLWISIRGEDGSLTRTRDVLRIAAQRQIPVLLHVYQRTDGNLPGEISMGDFVTLSREQPDAVMIAAHAGGNWRQSLGLFREAGPRAFLDICGGYPERGMLDALARDVGAGRILYGSDAHGRSFPSQLAKVSLSRLPPVDREKVLWRNAARIYGLDPLPTPQAALRSRAPAKDAPPFSEEHFCFCGNWPYNREARATPRQLQRALEAHRIRRAFTGDLTGLFMTDALRANRAFLKACRPHNRIRPLATLNPTAFNAAVAVCEAAGEGFTGGLLSPYLHHWDLSAPAYRPFFDLCAKCGLALWINTSLSDHRFRHPSLLARPVASSEVLAFIEQAPPVPIVFQGLPYAVIAAALERLPASAHIRFDVAQLTDFQFMTGSLIRAFGARRLVMGSEFPFREMNQVRQAFPLA